MGEYLLVLWRTRLLLGGRRCPGGRGPMVERRCESLQALSTHCYAFRRLPDFNRSKSNVTRSRTRITLASSRFFTLTSLGRHILIGYSHRPQRNSQAADRRIWISKSNRPVVSVFARLQRLQILDPPELHPIPPPPLRAPYQLFGL